MRRRHLLLLHRYVGLMLGAWFVLLGLTGSVLVFQHEIDEWLNPALLRAVAPGPGLGAPAILERARQHFPAASVERISVPRTQASAYRLLVRTQATRRIGSPRLEACFDPVSGALLGTRPVDVYGISPALLIRTVYDLHHKVLLGNEGKTAVGIVGLTLLATLLFGVTLAMANARRLGPRGLLGIRASANAARVLYDVHRATGLWAALLLLMSTVTGFALVFPDYARELVGVFSRVAPFPSVPFVVGEGRVELPSFNEQWERVRLAFPKAAVTEVHLPLRTSSGFLFYLRSPGDVNRLGDTLVWVDPRTAEVLLERSDSRRSAGEKLLHWLFPLHSGIAFGTAGRILMCLAGLVPALLATTGLLVWERKRRSRRLESDRRRMMQRNARAPGVAGAIGHRPRQPDDSDTDKGL